MSATAADPAVTVAPLPAETLPPAVAKLVAGAAPAKMMALKGIAPLRPAELLTAIYQLSFDSDGAVKAAADAAPAALPDKVLGTALGEALPAPVLHFFALRLEPTRAQPLARILLNGATADGTFVALAARLRESELEIIVQNETRLLRCPAIVAALYANRQARMSSVNRAIELCARNGVRVEGIPAFDEVARSIAGDPAAVTAEADEVIAGLLEGEEEEKEKENEKEEEEEKEKEKGEEEVLEAIAVVVEDDGDPPVQGKKKGHVIEFGKLKLHEKIRLATLGNAYCRQNLMTDPNRLVAIAAISSPLITESEVVRAAASRNVSEDVIRYIAGSREYLKLYAVKLNLVKNPKTPLAQSMRLLNVLHAEDLKTLAKSKNIPAALAQAAQRLEKTRGGHA